MPKNATYSPSDILHAVTHRVLPWLQEDTIKRLSFAAEYLHAATDVVAQCGIPPIGDGEIGQELLTETYWPGDHLFTLRFPYLCYVLDGEIDVRVYSKSAGLQRKAITPQHPACIDITLPQRSALLIAPGTPCRGCGATQHTPLHWERSLTTPSDSRVLWIQILPGGAICHICTTAAGFHGWSPCFFLPDLQVSFFTDLLIEELQSRGHGFMPLAHNHLLSIFLRLQRGFMQRQPFHIEEERPCQPFATANPLTATFAQNAGKSRYPSLNATIAARARAYIQAHLNEPLNVALIAKHSHVSSPHLAKVFKEETNLSVMKYVTQCRMERAESLLRDTELSIEEIGRLLGYRYLPHFSQVFTREMKVSPLAFRRAHR